jgi:hypothetical protein
VKSLLSGVGRLTRSGTGKGSESAGGGAANGLRKNWVNSPGRAPSLGGSGGGSEGSGGTQGSALRFLLGSTLASGLTSMFFGTTFFGATLSGATAGWRGKREVGNCAPSPRPAICSVKYPGAGRRGSECLGCKSWGSALKTGRSETGRTGTDPTGADRGGVG